jgi:hypothetical protein
MDSLKAISSYSKPDAIYLIASSILAAIGLDTGNSTAIIGSMLVSPLTRSLLNVTEHAENNKEYVIIFLQLLILCIISIVIGFIYYYMTLPIKSYKNKNKLEINNEILKRGKFKGVDYIYDIVYGFVIGLCLYTAIKNSSNDFYYAFISIIAGAGIGMAVLPAFVNSGLMMGARVHGHNTSHLALSSAILGIIYICSISSGIGFGKLLRTNNIYPLNFKGY